jgi:hypothetical protein
MSKRDNSDRYLPAGETYDLPLLLFQSNDPLITSDESNSAADSHNLPTKGGLKNLEESEMEHFS